jgi:dsDNA-binding SOS-regulon protein
MANEIEYKYDANGDIDMNYYLHEAEQMRAEYILELFTALKTWLHDSAHKTAEKLFSHHTHLPH